MAAAFALGPGFAFPQTPGRTYRIAWLVVRPLYPGESGPFLPYFNPFRERLAERGFVDGRNLEIRVFAREGTQRSFESLAEEVIRWKPDAIQVRGALNAKTAHAAIGNIPIVFSGVSDPVAEGLVATLSRPGSNLTGVAQSFDGLEAKLLELLRELVPGSRRIAVIYDAATNPADVSLAHIRAAAARYQFAIEEHNAEGADGFPKALARAAASRPDAVLPAGMISDVRFYERLAEFQGRWRIPVLDNELESTKRGGSLAAIGEEVADVYRRKADVTVKLLMGSKAAEVPVDRPTRVQLMVNRRVARELGMAIPQKVLLRADRLVD